MGKGGGREQKTQQGRMEVVTESQILCNNACQDPLSSEINEVASASPTCLLHLFVFVFVFVFCTYARLEGGLAPLSSFLVPRSNEQP